MNRKIKFRYWNSIANIMVNEPKMPYKEGWTITQLFSDRGWVWLQYTGLKDKQGKEIYEGDVIIVNSQTGEVEFRDGCFFVQFEYSKQNLNETKSNYKKIIGNIYENKALLK